MIFLSRSAPRTPSLRDCHRDALPFSTKDTKEASDPKIFVLGVSSVFIGCENIVMAELGSTTGAEEEETNRYGRFRPPHSSPVYAL